MAVLALFQPDARAEARLSSALATAHDIRVAPTWSALREAVRSEDVEGCIVDAEHPDPESVAGLIGEVTRGHAEIAVIVVAHGQGVESLYGLGELGVDGVVVVGEPPGMLRSDVDDALARARARRALRLLGGRLPEPGPLAVSWAVEHAGDHATVERLAVALAHTAGSLRETCQEANLPTPGKILLWGRLVLAGARLDRDGRRVEDVAYSLGYATSTSLARAMKLHTGLTPAEVSRDGGMDVVLDALTRRPLEAP